MTETIIAALISAGASLLVCLVTSSAQQNKTRALLDYRLEQLERNKRITDAAKLLESTELCPTEWDEPTIRQLVETVKVLSKDEITVTFKGGIEIQQRIETEETI